MAENKRKGTLLQRSRSIFKHVLIHGVFIWIWLWTYDITLKISASLYIIVIHYFIDISRTYYEEILIEKNEFHVFSRKELFKWLTRKPIDKDTKQFLGIYLKIWWVLIVPLQ